MNILITDPLDQEGIELLRAAGHAVTSVEGIADPRAADLLATCDVLIVRGATRVTAAVIDSMPALCLVARAGAGVDNVDVGAATARRVHVMNAPGANSIAVAELTLAMILALARRLPEATASMRAGRWERHRWIGRELARATLGLVGFGRIARAVAMRARAFEMTIVAADPYVDPVSIRSEGVEPMALDTLLECADVVSVHVPLTPVTAASIGDRELRRCKPGVLIVNTARGGVIDEAALLDGLREERIGGVALDVFGVEPPHSDDPLIAHPRVLATPHIGAATIESRRHVAVQVARQVIAYGRGEPAEGLVNGGW